MKYNTVAPMLLLLLSCAVCAEPGIGSAQVGDGNTLTISTDEVLLNISVLILSKRGIERCCSFPEFTSLVSLNLDDNELAEFPDLRSVRHTLSWLSVMRNRISIVPGVYTDLPLLKSLWFSMNDLQEFPNLTGMASLEILWLPSNNISWVAADRLEPLTNLQQLDLSDNALITLPDANLTSLVCLNLNNNPPMTDLPMLPEIGKSLRVLSIGEVNVSAEALRHMTRLSVLSINSTKPIDVRAIMDGCPRLNSLHIPAAAIKELPPDLFAVMTELRALNVANNKLETVPDVSRLKTSLSLRISGNPLVCDSRVDALHLAVREGLLKYDNVICTSPPDVAGKPLRSLAPVVHTDANYRSHWYYSKSNSCTSPGITSITNSVLEDDCPLYCIQNSACVGYSYRHETHSCGIIEVGRPALSEQGGFRRIFFW